MTKKSLARLARDAEKKRTQDQLKKNNCWDDLNNIYQECCNLLGAHTHLAGLAQNKEVIAKVGDKETLTRNLRMLAQDLGNLKSELLQIRATHEGKTGGSNDPDVVFSTIEVFERYNLFMERHEAVVMPTVYHILEQFKQAEDAVAAEKAAADANDPSVIIDVEFKEEAVVATTSQE